MSEDAWRIECDDGAPPGVRPSSKDYETGPLAAAVEELVLGRENRALVEYHIRRLASDGASADEIAVHTRLTMQDVLSVLEAPRRDV